MSDTAQAFAAALEVERKAALCADFETLLRVQDEKRELLPLFLSCGDQWLIDELSERARKNLQLMRQLLACIQGMVGAVGAGNESAYTASGQNSIQPAAQLTLRTRL
jgi:hypothetical protein